MTITPNELLDTSISQLRTLAAFLREQLGNGADRMPSAAQVRACKELLGALSALIGNFRPDAKRWRPRQCLPDPNGQDRVPDDRRRSGL